MTNEQWIGLVILAWVAFGALACWREEVALLIVAVGFPVTAVAAGLALLTGHITF